MLIAEAVCQVQAVFGRHRIPSRVDCAAVALFDACVAELLCLYVLVQFIIIIIICVCLSSADAPMGGAHSAVAPMPSEETDDDDDDSASHCEGVARALPLPRFSFEARKVVVLNPERSTRPVTSYVY